MDAAAARARLIGLQAERFEALQLGVEDASPYLVRLEAAIEDARAEYVMSAVLEIALLRGALTDALQG